jgi:hypothetical protein
LKAFEVSRVFFDVSFEWDESLVDEVRDIPIRVGLSLQLSTCASSGRRRKVNQERFALSFRLLEGRIGIFDPIDEHVLLLRF